MGRSKQNPEESPKRVRILTIAAKMFMTQNYSALSMDALARAVPVSKRTLYNHFKDKKALFAAVMQIRCQRLFDKLAQTLRDDADAEQVLTRMGDQFLSVALAPDAVNIHRTAITQSQQFPELGRLFYESGPRRATAILEQYLRKLHSRGILHLPNPELAANMFFGMLANRVQMKCMVLPGTRVSLKEKQAIVRYAVRVFLNGQQPG